MVKKRSFWKLILLSVVTLGIYGLVFWFKWVKDINKMGEGCSYKSPNYIVVILLSLITCGIYGYVWYYKVGNLVAEEGSKYGVSLQENGTTVLLWMLFGALLCGIGPFIAMNILIKNTNAVAEAYNAQNGLTA